MLEFLNIFVRICCHLYSVSNYFFSFVILYFFKPWFSGSVMPSPAIRFILSSLVDILRFILFFTNSATRMMLGTCSLLMWSTRLSLPLFLPVLPLSLSCQHWLISVTIVSKSNYKLNAKESLHVICYEWLVMWGSFQVLRKKCVTTADYSPQSFFH